MTASLVRRPWLIRHALRHPRLFTLGFQEASSSSGMTFGHPWTSRSLAYDAGRDLRRWGKA